VKARALKFVRYDRIQSHLKRGWIAMIPNAPMHHHTYGIELAWLCDCPIPCEIKFNQVTHRVPVASPTERNADERAASGA
jgi:hypothetical protein